MERVYRIMGDLGAALAVLSVAAVLALAFIAMGR